MKKWNKQKDKTARFSDLADPIQRAIRFAYKLERKNIDKDINWTGYDIGEDDKATCSSPNEKFTAECLAYALEDQDMDALQEIITVAIQIGIEQGRRIHRKQVNSHLSGAKLGIDILQEHIKSIKDE